MTEVHFTGSMIMNVKKDMFLSNKKNKQSFLCLLSRKLEQIGCQVSHARGDADMLIVQTAIQSSSRFSKVLVGDDTDLLILLCFHTPVWGGQSQLFSPDQSQVIASAASEPGFQTQELNLGSWVLT